MLRAPLPLTQKSQSVAEYLVNERNISPNRIEVNGLGEDDLKNPLNPTAQKIGESKL